MYEEKPPSEEPKFTRPVLLVVIAGSIVGLALAAWWVVRWATP